MELHENIQVKQSMVEVWEKNKSKSWDRSLKNQFRYGRFMAELID
jgi:hypothetical protein